LLSAGPADRSTIARAYEAQTGHALPARAFNALSAVAPPETAGAAAGPGTTPASPATGPAATVHPSDATPRLYIAAQDARALATPMLFGTFLETYARRHRWLGSMPVVTRIRWRIGGAVAAAAGIALLSAGVDAYSDAEAGLGLGLLFGGLVAFLLAPAMVQPSAEGGRIRAQLAAYRRTLQLTFRSASSIGDAVGPAGLAWLSTPDQAIAWAVALGLAPDVEALLARSAPDTSGTAADAPTWYHPAHRRRAAGGGVSVPVSSSPAVMFAGIEAISSSGAVGPRFLRPMRAWWPT
jgi:hypothetical protein